MLGFECFESTVLVFFTSAYRGAFPLEMERHTLLSHFDCGSVAFEADRDVALLSRYILLPHLVLAHDAEPDSVGGLARSVSTKFAYFR